MKSFDVYKELKKLDYDLYIKTIEKSGMLCVRNNLNLRESANLEETLVEFALNIRKGNR